MCRTAISWENAFRQKWENDFKLSSAEYHKRFYHHSWLQRKSHDEKHTEIPSFYLTRHLQEQDDIPILKHWYVILFLEMSR